MNPLGFQLKIKKVIFDIVKFLFFREMMKVMKTHGHLVEVDRLLARSWMYLMTLNELVECNSLIHAELLDILQLFTMKCPEKISNSTSTVSIMLSQEITIYVLITTN